MGYARQQTATIQAPAAAHAGGLCKAGNNERGGFCLASTAFAGQRTPWKDRKLAL